MDYLILAESRAMGNLPQSTSAASRHLFLFGLGDLCGKKCLFFGLDEGERLEYKKLSTSVSTRAKGCFSKVSHSKIVEREWLTTSGETGMPKHI